MGMKGILCVLALLVAVCTAVPTQLSYTLNTNYVYNVSGVVQNNGYDVNVDDFVPGYYSYMNAYLVIRATQENETAYTFAMNLFGTVVSASNSSTGGSPPASAGKALGYDMYFTQLKNGQITEILYNTADSEYYVSVKLGVINAFQTSIVSVGQELTVLESDPVGNHTAQVSGSSGGDGSLTLTKVFSQSDFSAFPDPTVNAENMYIEAQSVTAVHASGYIMSTNSQQMAVFTNGDPASVASLSSSNKKRSLSNSTGFDMQLSGLGSLDVKLVTNTQLSSKTFTPIKPSGMKKTTMFGYAIESTLKAKARAATLVDFESSLDSLLSLSPISVSSLSKIANHFQYNPEDLMKLVPAFETQLDEAVIRDRLFFILTAVKNEAFLVKYGLNSDKCDVVMRATLAAAHFESSEILLFSLHRVTQMPECEFAQSTALSIVKAKETMHVAMMPVQGSDFPFNKSLSEGITLGGKVAAVNFTADLFVGTNLNCNNPQFNYEGSAEGSATAVLFGYAQQAFDAKIVYGQQNGAPLADALTLSVWGNVVYNKALPVVACQQGNYPLAHIAPGFSISHTLWVSIIPIVFSASANLDLSASWGWNVCPTQLSASISVTGDGSISLSGSSYTDLLLLRAGFDLEGSFETAITPELFVQGTACQVGFEVDAQNKPLTAAITSYYQWKECKFLFFDCKWGNHNQQTWWSWSEPSKDIVLYKLTYDIKL